MLYSGAVLGSKEKWSKIQYGPVQSSEVKSSAVLLRGPDREYPWLLGPYQSPPVGGPLLYSTPLYSTSLV